MAQVAGASKTGWAVDLPRGCSEHACLLLTHTALDLTCAAGVTSKKANCGAHTLPVASGTSFFK